MRYLINDCTDPHWNMAFDQWCLEHLDTEEPVFYLWRNRPSVIVGLNQNAWAEVNLPYMQAHGITLARRVTGGGAVYHDLQNLNYTIVGRTSDIERDYPGYTSLIAGAMGRLGLDVEISGRNDILTGGRKISGYAKRVWRDRLMVHGTLMYDVDLETLTRVLDVPGSKMNSKGIASVRSRVANIKDLMPGIAGVEDLQDRLTAVLSNGDAPLHLSPEALTQIDELCSERFSRWEWNWGHSPKADLTRSGSLPCGTITAHICIEQGMISAISLTGDYIGSLPSKAVGDILQGCRYRREDILDRLSAIPVGMYFEKTTPAQITEVVI